MMKFVARALVSTWLAAVFCETYALDHDSKASAVRGLAHSSSFRKSSGSYDDGLNESGTAFSLRLERFRRSSRPVTCKKMDAAVVYYKCRDVETNEPFFVTAEEYREMREASKKRKVEDEGQEQYEEQHGDEEDEYGEDEYGEDEYGEDEYGEDDEDNKEDDDDDNDDEVVIVLGVFLTLALIIVVLLMCCLSRHRNGGCAALAATRMFLNSRMGRCRDGLRGRFRGRGRGRANGGGEKEDPEHGKPSTSTGIENPQASLKPTAPSDHAKFQPKPHFYPPLPSYDPHHQTPAHHLVPQSEQPAPTPYPPRPSHEELARISDVYNEAEQRVQRFVDGAGSLLDDLQERCQRLERAEWARIEEKEKERARIEEEEQEREELARIEEEEEEQERARIERLRIETEEQDRAEREEQEQEREEQERIERLRIEMEEQEEQERVERARIERLRIEMEEQERVRAEREEQEEQERVERLRIEREEKERTEKEELERVRTETEEQERIEAEEQEQPRIETAAAGNGAEEEQNEEDEEEEEEDDQERAAQKGEDDARKQAEANVADSEGMKAEAEAGVDSVKETKTDEAAKGKKSKRRRNEVDLLKEDQKGGEGSATASGQRGQSSRRSLRKK